MIKLSDLNRGDRLILKNGAIFEASVPKTKGVNQIFVRINPEEDDNGLLITSNQLNEDFSLNGLWSRIDSEDYIVEVRLANGKSYQIDNKENIDNEEEDCSVELENCSIEDLLQNSGTIEALEKLISIEEVAFEDIKSKYENGKISKKEYTENERLHKNIHERYRAFSKGIEIKKKLEELEKKVNDLDEEKPVPDEISDALMEVLKDMINNN